MRELDGNGRLNDEIVARLDNTRSPSVFGPDNYWTRTGED